MAEHPIVVVPPALGVQVTDDPVRPDRLQLQIDDLGGRGWAWGVVLVGMSRRQGRWQPAVPIASSPSRRRWPRSKALPYGYWMKLPGEGRPPYRLRLPGGRWPARGEAALALLVYYALPRVGGNLPGQVPMLPAGVGVDVGAAPVRGNFPSLAKRVKEFLDTASDDTIALGIVRRPPAGPPLPVRPGGRPERVIVGSCLYPCDVFDRTPDDELAPLGPPDRSLAALAELVAPMIPPPTVVLTGDQVYVDATGGLFDPRVLDDRFRVPYERRGESVGLRRLQQRQDLTLHPLIDDHEIVDNWQLHDDPDAFQHGVATYIAHQRIDLPAPPRPAKYAASAAPLPAATSAWASKSASPPVPPPPAASPPYPPLWRADASVGSLPLFLADTRTERRARTAATLNDAATQIIGADQWQALDHWLQLAAMTPDKPCLLASAAPLLPRSLAVARDPWCALLGDSWEAYPASFHRLLARVCELKLQRLVVLCGGDHLPFITRATLHHDASGARAQLLVVHAPALFAPYPFANARREDYEATEGFAFSTPAGGDYRCEVDTRFPPAGDGFALVELAHLGASSGWQVTTHFHRASAAPGTQPVSHVWP